MSGTFSGMSNFTWLPILNSLAEAFAFDPLIITVS